MDLHYRNRGKAVPSVRRLSPATAPEEGSRDKDSFMTRGDSMASVFCYIPNLIGRLYSSQRV